MKRVSKGFTGDKNLDAHVCVCGHVRGKHDPEDGDCEAGCFPPCECKMFAVSECQACGDSIESCECAMVDVRKGAVERVQPEPAKFEVGKTYPADVNGEPGSVTFFSQDAADAYSKQLKGEPVPSTSVEPQPLVTAARRVLTAFREGRNPTFEELDKLETILLGASVEPQVEPTGIRAIEAKYRKLALERGSSGEMLWDLLGELKLAADSVSHPPLEREAREWGNKDWEAIYLMVWKTLEPFNVWVSDVHRLTDQLAKFVRERDKR